MAEPLLKRTISRLRGKDRSRRKTDPKLSVEEPKPKAHDAHVDGLKYIPGKASTRNDTFLSSPSTAADVKSPSPTCNPITVSKKQKWAQQGSATPSTSSVAGSTPRPFNWNHSQGKSHVSIEHSWNQKPTQDQVIHHGDRTCVGMACDLTDAPCFPVSSTTGLKETFLTGGGSTSVPFSSISTKLYLQSLDRSSRAWVLSSGKPQSSDEVCEPQEQSASNIWYNPIPEDEDRGRMRDSRDEGGLWPESTNVNISDYQLDCTNVATGLHTHDTKSKNTDVPPSDCSPSTQKKEGLSSSVIDRIKSPGTVRKLSMKMKKIPELRRKLSLRSNAHPLHPDKDQQRGAGETTKTSTMSNQNIVSRYHLDSSTPPIKPQRRSSRKGSATKGGYLSDGDSPELLPRQEASLTKACDTSCDISSFRLYVDSDLPRCNQRVTGLLTVHLLGLEEMKTSRSEGNKEVFLVVQIDGVTQARTAVLTLQGSTLSLNHTFHLELERAKQLRIVVLTPGSNQQAAGEVKTGIQTSSSPTRNRVCCLGGVSIPPLFKGSRSQQLCVKLEPRGLLYVKLTIQEQWDTQPTTDTLVPPNVFGVELRHLVEKEGSATPVPLLIQKSVAEIERRGLRVVGLYRLCGSAAVKKELRDWFERNSSDVCLSEDLYPDINVITGILKDYLRELPSPLITRTLYQVVTEAMTLRPLPVRPVTPQTHVSQSVVELLACLPPPERATLSLLLDHLSLVASFSSSNRMTHQNLAVCFGPVLLTPTQDAWRGGGGGTGSRRRGQDGGRGFYHGEEVANAVDFKRHIEALHYLLQLWPVPTRQVPTREQTSTLTYDCSGNKEPGSVTQNPDKEVVVSRRGRGGLARIESPQPVNRYAGDWSICGKDLLSGQEADYDEVAGSENEGGSSDEEQKKEVWSPIEGGGLYVDDFLDFDAPFNCRLSLKDFDLLIHDLDRELSKPINICL
ncbi:rho GTPase-activating protein SYDE1 [Thalassophryne amazonica]|uniref:rho GTPase-activating protein SYDE1 n=1 Tax=Thalassophryne amazonica TaxID=390379 RepID=UPI00147170A8|nr:rho GTPase-activating protein SYDE1 [Thalassophryne amazonica]